jgi:hypothetical protein
MNGSGEDLIFGSYPGICLRGLGQTGKVLSGQPVQAEIWTHDLPTTKLQT